MDTRFYIDIALIHCKPHYCRFVTSLVYYGVSLNVGNFGLDIYLTQLIFGIAEFPARLACFPLIQRFGRRICQSVVLLLGGTACLVIPAIPGGEQVSFYNYRGKRDFDPFGVTQLSPKCVRRVFCYI